MTMVAGTRLGPYEILAPLGAGGMGEVYRARDTRLGRDVAVKVLPEQRAASREVRARFEREARTVSSLNHPHICTLYDVGREGDTDYLVMELIEGETLAQRLARGALPQDQVLKLGAEIADALDRAHRAGVIHRDLKPGNVMLTKSGTKLMDFGLARPAGMGGPESGSGVTLATLAQSPTMGQPLTVAGTIVGTFQYMAPEQLEGHEADARSDIWALGCVLYEMAAARPAFEGKSQASLVGAIMNAQPLPISQLVPMTPPALDGLVRACLVKDAADRIQSAHDVKLQLEWIAGAGSQAGAPLPRSTRRRSRERLAWGVAIAAVLLGVMAVAFVSRPRPLTPAVEASLLPPLGVVFSSSTVRPLPLALSPDGSVIAFCARNGEGPDMLWVRSLASQDARSLAGTEGAQGPFFSPDGRSLGFFADGKLKRIDVAGGPVIQLADRMDPRGGTWNQDGVILFTRYTFGPVSRISADGGSVMDATTLDSTLGEATHRYPYFLPDGRHFLYLARQASAGSGKNPTIYAGELGSARRTRLVEVASNVVYASGHLLYIRGGVLVAQPFDPSALAVTGPAVPLVDDARMDERFSRGVFAASANGVLVCMTGKDQTRTQLRWLDRSGHPLGDIGEPADYTYGGAPQMSPDGRFAAMPILNRDRGNSDVWTIDLTTGRRRKLTVDMKDHPAAAWVFDGKAVVVATMEQAKGSLDLVDLDGSNAGRLVTVQDYVWPQSSRDGFFLYTAEHSGTRSESDLLAVGLAGDRAVVPVANGPGGESDGQFSPDGRLVAYMSDETGRGEIFVAAFPQPGGRWQVSQDGGAEPRWRRDGRELFYVDPENYLVCIDVERSATGFQTGAVRRLFQFHGAGGPWRYDVSPAGDRFLVTVPLEGDLASPVTLITDWTRKLAQRQRSSASR
jgi:serine/threonine protein kinase/Tol biopolymer transport system component